MKNKVNEWQEMSLKKDVEKIVKITSKEQHITQALIFDLIIAIIALLLDNVISGTEQPKLKLGVFILLIIFFTLPFVVLLFLSLYRFCVNKSKKYTSPAHQELIDSFDNDICYYVMMANSFKQMLIEEYNSHEQNMSEFFYIETWYYINKAKYKLYRMVYKTKHIFTIYPEDVLKKNIISVDRLKNILLLIEDIKVSIESFIKTNNIIISNSIHNINKEYDEYYKDFVDEVKENFPIALNNINISFDSK